MKRSPLVVLVLAAPLLFVGCTPAASDAPVAVEPAPAVSESSSTQAPAPTVVAAKDLDGTTVPVVIGTALAITVDKGTEAQWTGTTADPDVASFSAGGTSEGATFNPEFVAHKTGTTAATLTGPDGKQHAFTISVIAP